MSTYNRSTAYRGIKTNLSKPFPVRREDRVLTYRGIQYISKG